MQFHKLELIHKTERQKLAVLVRTTCCPLPPDNLQFRFSSESMKSSEEERKETGRPTRSRRISDVIDSLGEDAVNLRRRSTESGGIAISPRSRSVHGEEFENRAGDPNRYLSFQNVVRFGLQREFYLHFVLQFPSRLGSGEEAERRDGLEAVQWLTVSRLVLLYSELTLCYVKMCRLFHCSL